jgi:hypothetical protein
MSQTKKRLKNHVKGLSAVRQKKDELHKMRKILLGTLQNIDKELDELDIDSNKHLVYLQSKQEVFKVFNHKLKLPNNDEIEVVVLITNDMIAVAHNNQLGYAKKHELDKFDFDKGFNLACMRLMAQLFDY